MVSARPPEPVHRLTADTDPVTAFLAAHARGGSVAVATSGTSGAARWVVRSTASWVSSFPAVSALAGLDATSRMWIPGPLSSTMNLFAAVQVRYLGATRAEGPDDATHAQLTPAVLDALLRDGVALDRLTLVVAGDRLPVALHDRARRSGCVVHHYYGAAELSFVAWGRHAEDLHPFPGVRVADRDGEIWVRSPYLCQGYDGSTGPLRVGPDGFASVGDRGRLHRGRLVVHGRPDAVQVGGDTVEPHAVEALLQACAHGTVVVVPLPHGDLGHLLTVVLCSAADHPAVRQRARSALQGAHRPRRWFHLEVMPTTTAGKVDRTALADLVARGDDRLRVLV